MKGAQSMHLILTNLAALRHECNQDDSMAAYGWSLYDPRVGGSQTLQDAGNAIDITTELLKDPGDSPHGGNWGVRVRGRPRAGAPSSLRTKMVFYFGLESPQSDGKGKKDDAKCEAATAGGDVECIATTEKLGKFRLQVLRGDENPGRADGPTFVHSLTVPGEDVWTAKGESSICVVEAAGTSNGLRVDLLTISLKTFTCDKSSPTVMLCLVPVRNRPPAQEARREKGSRTGATCTSSSRSSTALSRCDLSILI